MTAVPSLDVPGEDRRHYTRSLNFNQKENRALQVGDRLEFELSHFLSGVPNGRNNYYGTAILYIVGQGVVPFEAQGPQQDSFPMPVAGKLGGDTTLNYQYSNEPDDHFMQMPTNLSNINGQLFVLGRRVHHTDFGDGSHDESAENPELHRTVEQARYKLHQPLLCRVPREKWSRASSGSGAAARSVRGQSGGCRRCSGFTNWRRAAAAGDQWLPPKEA